MRQARVEDWRRRLTTQEAQWETRLHRFSFRAIPSLGSAELDFASPVTLLSGANGTGKTTLLKALWATLDPAAASAAVVNDRKLVSGSSQAALLVGQTQVTLDVEYRGDDIHPTGNMDVPVAYVDSASESLKYQEDFCKFESAEEITNGYARRELKPEAIAEINYLLKRNYRAITLYEVEVGREVPFFEVTYGDDRYDSRTMGAGEISALHIWWELTRAQENSLLLLEEPEAFLSYACQYSLADLLISVVVKKRICTVISSHAAPIIESLPQKSLRFLSRGQGGLQVIGDDPRPIVLRSIGIDPPLKAIIFVEDYAAKAFTKSLLERLNPALARQICIDVRAGEGEISKALRVTKTFDLPLKFVGLYDGDFANRIPSDVAKVSTHLPGTEPIEVHFREMVSADPMALERATGVGGLQAVLNELEGANFHDWFDEISKELGMSKEQLFPILFNLWISDEENSKAARETFENLKTLLEL